MEEQHPNLALFSRLDIRNLDASADLFCESFVWRYVNPNLPDLEGDYAGVEGMKRFFGVLGVKMKGTFNVEPISVVPFGDEFVVTHVRDTMEHDGKSIALDAVVVWRIIGGKFAEAWDIPATKDIATS